MRDRCPCTKPKRKIGRHTDLIWARYLGALFVKPDRRGHGLGVALVCAIEAHARLLGHPAIYLNAADALARFYEALGWRFVERAYSRKQLNIMQRDLASTGS